MHLLQPDPDSATEEAGLTVLDAAELCTEAVLGDDRNYRWTAVHGPALPDEPHVEIQDAGRMRQRRHNLALDRNTVLVNFAIECLAEDDLIFEVFSGRWPVFLGGVEPKLHAVEELKAGQIDDSCSVRLLFGAEEDCGGEDSLEPLYHAAIVRAVFGQAKELKDLGGTSKANGSVPLHDREGGKPDRDQAVLSVGQAESGMGGDFEKEAAVAAGVHKLVAPRPPQRNAAKHEGSSVVAKLLVTGIALLADKLDGLDLLEPSLGDLKCGECGLKVVERQSAAGGARGASCVFCRLGTVPKPFQKCMLLGQKGRCFERKQVPRVGVRPWGR